MRVVAPVRFALDAEPFAHTEQDDFAKIFEFLAQHPAELLRIPRVRDFLTMKRFELFDRSGAPVRALSEGDVDVMRETIAYNITQARSGNSLARPEVLVRPVLSIDRVATRLEEMRVLSLGPRTEAEVLMLMAHGFAPDNIAALDLFSYSPWIETGDICRMPYDDGRFDVIFAGWVLPYTKRPGAAAREIVRVAAPGAIVAVGIDYDPEGWERERALDPAAAATVLPSAQAILDLFGGEAGHVFFNNDAATLAPGRRGHTIVVFELPKARRPSVAAPAARATSAADGVVGPREVAQLTSIVPELLAICREGAAGHPMAAEVPALLQGFVGAYERFAATGITPHDGYACMRRLSYVSDGLFNQAMRAFYGAVHPLAAFTASGDVFGGLDARAIAAAAREVDEQGFCVLPARVPDDLCDRLLRYALTHPAEAQSPPAPAPALVRYERGRPTTVKYEFPEPALMHDPDVQRLVCDPAMVGLARAVLGCAPVLNLTALWWSTAYLAQPDSYAAQLYHFDMDQAHFVKLFVYLTDVTAATGPHCFVRGSHRRKPLPLRRDGRIGDDEIARHYRPDEVAEITGPRGTVIVGDTRGLHKGKHLAGGDRLIFQMVFSASLFGAPYVAIPLAGPVDPRLDAARREHPRTYARMLPA